MPWKQLANPQEMIFSGVVLYPQESSKGLSLCFHYLLLNILSNLHKTSLSNPFRVFYVKHLRTYPLNRREPNLPGRHCYSFWTALLKNPISHYLQTDKWAIDNSRLAGFRRSKCLALQPNVSHKVSESGGSSGWNAKVNMWIRAQAKRRRRNLFVRRDHWQCCKVPSMLWNGCLMQFG